MRKLIGAALLFTTSVCMSQYMECRSEASGRNFTAECSGPDGLKSELVCRGGSCTYSAWEETEIIVDREAYWKAKEQEKEYLGSHRLIKGEWVKIDQTTTAQAVTLDKCDKHCTMPGYDHPDAACNKKCYARVARLNQAQTLEWQLSAACNVEPSCIILADMPPDPTCKRKCEMDQAAKQGWINDEDKLMITNAINQRIASEK